MRMSDFVVREAIVPDLTATNKEGVIREMVEGLRAAGQFRGADLEDIIRAILKRELLGSTGIGRGVAIPHTKHTSVERLVGTVAISQQGHGLREPRWRAGPCLRLAHLAAGSARRPFRALENVSRSPPRRQLRQRPSRRHHSGRNHCPARQGGTLTVFGFRFSSFRLLALREGLLRPENRQPKTETEHCHEWGTLVSEGGHQQPARASTCARWPPSRSSASRFQSNVKVSRGRQSVNGKSILDLMLLATLAQGTELDSSKSQGPDARKPLSTLWSTCSKFADGGGTKPQAECV